MAIKHTFGEYSAYDTKAGIRFMKNNRLTSEKSVPPEIVQFLKGKLTGERGVVEEKPKKFPRPSEEELARMRQESIDREAKPQSPEPKVEPLTEDDFDSPDSNGEAPLPRTDESVRPTEVASEPTEVSSDFLESVSIHTASLSDMAEALYNRFGLYTIYLNKLPEGDEVNPLTGEGFTKYHLGIAYQAAIRAQNTGILTRDPELNRKAIDQGRDASENFQSQFEHVPRTLGEARQANSFDFRTSVRGNQEQSTYVIEHVRGEDGVVRAVQRELSPEEYSKSGTRSVHHPEEDEPLAEPAMGRQVIRPDW